MGFSFVPRVVFFGVSPLDTLPAVARDTELPPEANVVIAAWGATHDATVLETLRRHCHEALLVAWFPGDAVAADIGAALTLGYDEVVFGLEHLQVRLRQWRHQFGLGDAHRARVEDHGALVSLIDEMAEKPDLQEVLRVAILRMSGLYSIDRASVVLLKPGHDVAFVVMESEKSILENLVIRIDDYPEFREIIRSRQPLVISDVLAHTLMIGVRNKLEQAATPHRSAVLFPLIRKEQVVGALFLRGKEPLANVGDRLMEMGRLIASITSIALGYALEHDMLLSTQRELLRKQEDTRQELLNLRQFSEVFEQSFDGILITDAVGAIRYANASAGAILQNKPDVLKSMTFFELLSPRSHVLTERAFRGDPVGDAYGYVDLLIPDEMGLETVISAAIRPLAEDEGVLISFRDVTELREIESELRQTKEFLENLIQSSVDAIVAADVEGRIILFNRAAEHILGYPAREVVGRMSMAAFYPAGEADDILRRLRSESYGGRGRLELVRKDLVSKSGELVPVNLTASIIYEGDREVATVGIFTDLRERMKMEEKLNFVQQKLRMTERQAVAMELAGAAAHELNQPLTSILGYAEILKRRVPEGDPNRKAADVICRETERMAAIVKKIGQITAYDTRPYVGGSQILAIEQPSVPPKKP